MIQYFADLRCWMESHKKFAVVLIGKLKVANRNRAHLLRRGVDEADAYMSHRSAQLPGMHLVEQFMDAWTSSDGARGIFLYLASNKSPETFEEAIISRLGGQTVYIPPTPTSTFGWKALPMMEKLLQTPGWSDRYRLDATISKRMWATELAKTLNYREKRSKSSCTSFLAVYHS